MNPCKVTIADWDSTLITLFQIECRICMRMLGSFSKHETAMAWADAHARSNKHRR